MRSAVSQTMSGVLGDEELEELLLGLVGDETKRKLAQCHKVLLLEEAGQGVRDLLRRIDVPVQHAPAQLFGGRVDQLDLVGLADDPVRHPLADGHAGDLLHGVGHALEVLDVDSADDRDPGVEDLEHVLPPLGVGTGAGHVRVGELVDERHLWAAGKHRRQVHLLESRAAVLDDLAGNDFKVADLLGRAGPAVRLDKADDDVGAASVAPPALVEHRPGLADAGHRSEIETELAGRLDVLLGFVLVGAEVGTVTHRPSPPFDASSPPRWLPPDAT